MSGQADCYGCATMRHSCEHDGPDGVDRLEDAARDLAGKSDALDLLSHQVRGLIDAYRNKMIDADMDRAMRDSQ